jgi:hypothetical protein
MKNKEELPMNLDRGVLAETHLDFARNEEWAFLAQLFRMEPTDPASSDQPALDTSSADTLMELIVAPRNLRRAWRQVKGNRGAPGADGMTVHAFEAWVSENWAKRYDSSSWKGHIGHSRCVARQFQNPVAKENDCSAFQTCSIA